MTERKEHTPVWMTPAAWGALVPMRMVHCRTSSAPVVKKLPRASALRMARMICGKRDFVPSFSHSAATSASVPMRVRRSSKQTEMGMMGSPGECSLTQALILARCLFFCRR
jgi:hypothetical protein